MDPESHPIKDQMSQSPVSLELYAGGPKTLNSVVWRIVLVLPLPRLTYGQDVELTGWIHRGLDWRQNIADIVPPFPPATS